MQATQGFKPHKKLKDCSKIKWTGNLQQKASGERRGRSRCSERHEWCHREKRVTLLNYTKKKDKHVTRRLRHAGRTCHPLVKILNKKISNQKKMSWIKKRRGGVVMGTRPAEFNSGARLFLSLWHWSWAQCRAFPTWSGVRLQLEFFIESCKPSVRLLKELGVTSPAPKLGSEFIFPLIASPVALKPKVKVCDSILAILMKPTMLISD